MTQIRHRLRRIGYTAARVRRAIPAVWQFLRDKEGQQWARGWVQSQDVYEIRDPNAAEYFGWSWPGRPFVMGLYREYDAYDVAIEAIQLFWYIASGEEEADRCREADERLLSYAY